MYNISTSPSKLYPNQQSYLGAHKKEVDKVVHSWNDLKDRPFGEPVTETVVLPKMTIQVPTDDTGVVIDEKQLIDSGHTYTVTINENIYTLEAKTSVQTGFVMIGDDPQSGNIEYGFAIGADSSGTGFLCTTDKYVGKTVELKITASDIKTIDPKYLPNTAAGGMVIVVNQVYDDVNPTGEYISSHTYEEIMTAIASGVHVICVYDLYIMYPTMAPVSSYMSGISTLGESANVEFRTPYYGHSITIYDTGTVIVDILQGR